MAIRTKKIVLDASNKFDTYRDACKFLEVQIANLEAQLKAFKAEAIEAGKASYKLSTRDYAPNKETYIALHGAEAFNNHKKVGDVKTFTWY